MTTKFTSLKNFKKYAPLLIILSVLIVFLFFMNEREPIVIPSENPQKTTGWKEYKNSEFNFSFKYPEGLLSNFSVNQTDLGSATFKKLEATNQPNARPDPNSYNVTFEAGAVKHSDNLQEFIKTFPETKNASHEKIVLNGIEGIRVSNVEREDKAYFLYNFFKVDGRIYNFALLSDDPILIKANQQLLEEILSTTKFE